MLEVFEVKHLNHLFCGLWAKTSKIYRTPQTPHTADNQKRFWSQKVSHLLIKLPQTPETLVFDVFEYGALHSQVTWKRVTPPTGKFKEILVKQVAKFCSNSYTRTDFSYAYPPPSNYPAHALRCPSQSGDLKVNFPSNRTLDKRFLDINFLKWFLFQNMSKSFGKTTS